VAAIRRSAGAAVGGDGNGVNVNGEKGALLTDGFDGREEMFDLPSAADAMAALNMCVNEFDGDVVPGGDGIGDGDVGESGGIAALETVSPLTSTRTLSSLPPVTTITTTTTSASAQSLEQQLAAADADAATLRRDNARLRAKVKMAERRAADAEAALARADDNL
jgi:hypothetical protein